MRLSQPVGFTLVELVMVIVLLSIISIVAVPNFIDLRDDARSAVTKDEMTAIKRAIIGDARVSTGGTYPVAGYEADAGKLPGTLTDLVVQPAAVNTYDPLTRLGWRGPYVDSSANSDYQKDAWGTVYVFTTDPRRIRSWGPNKSDNAGADDDIDLTF